MWMFLKCCLKLCWNWISGLCDCDELVRCLFLLGLCGLSRYIVRVGMSVCDRMNEVIIVKIIDSVIGMNR